MKLGLIWATASLLVCAATGCTFSSKSDPGKSFVVGDAPDCEMVACGVGETMQVCTTTGAEGACASIAYEVGGQSFACSSCTDCAQAVELATQACGTAATTPPTMGTKNPPADAGSPPPSGGSTSCEATVACGGAGGGYQECVTTGANGACASISFRTNDGQTFACSGCECTSAEQQLAGYCEAEGPTGDAGVGSEDAGAGGTTCSTAVACGSNGTTYQACTTTDGAGGCAQISYQTSDGQSFDCNGCSDCSSAIEQVTSYCESQSSSGGGGGGQCGNAVCGSAASCCTCSGEPICYTLPAGYTCSSLGPTCS